MRGRDRAVRPVGLRQDDRPALRRRPPDAARRPSFGRRRDLAGRRSRSGRPMSGRSATCSRKRACSRIFRCARNLLYGHRRALRRGAEEAARLDDVVALLGIEGLLERSPLRLSGGERQRVAVGRALLSQPRLLLMDEPLAGLDRLSKDEILPYLEALHTALSIPILYVSHDLAEVERLADHLVLIEAGRVVAYGPLEELQADPELPVARLPEAAVALNATVTHYDGGVRAYDACDRRRNDRRARPVRRPGNAAAGAHRSLRRQPGQAAPGTEHDPQCAAGPRGGRRAAGCGADERRGPARQGRRGCAPAGAGHPEVLGRARRQAGRSGPRAGQERRARGCK